MRTARLVIGLLLIAPAIACAEEGFYLKDGDRVVFYGDSITEQRLYTTFTETFVVTRFPKMDVTFTHSGWGGDRVTGGGGGPIDRRLKRDVLAYKPTVMTIMLGMNDASYRAFDQGIFDTYARGSKKIVDEVKAQVPGIRITLIQPSPYDDVTRPPNFEGGYNAVLVRYGDYLKDLAKEEKVDLADLNTSVVAATRKAYETDPELSKKLNQDRVHPGPAGQLLMAEALLKAWNAPASVSDARISLKEEGDSQIQAYRAKVAGLSVKDNVVAWTQLDESLPFPIDGKDPVVALAVKSSDVVDQLDKQMLRIDGLKDATYTLRIDGEEVGSFSSEQLKNGVNLAVLATPMVKQAAQVHQLTLKHNKLHYERWRQFEVPMQDENLPHMRDFLQAFDALEGDVVKEQRAAAQPKPHKFELKPKS